MLTRYYIYHLQLKYFCGNKNGKYWSANVQNVRLFPRKCDAQNCKVQSSDYWMLKDAIVKEVKFKINPLPNVISVVEMAILAGTTVEHIQTILANLGFNFAPDVVIELELAELVLSEFGIDAAKHVAPDGFEVRFWEEYFAKRLVKHQISQSIR